MRPVCIAALFTVVKMWKQSKLMGKRTKRWELHVTMENYSVIEKENIAIFDSMVDLGSIMLSEISQRKIYVYDLM